MTNSINLIKMTFMFNINYRYTYDFNKTASLRTRHRKNFTL